MVNSYLYDLYTFPSTWCSHSTPSTLTHIRDFLLNSIIAISGPSTTNQSEITRSMTVAGEERGAPVPAGNNKVDLLIRSLGISDESQQIWYAKTSSLLLRILQSTGYDIHQQLQYLTLYHTQLLPWLGPYPHMWDSFLTYSGVPVEFSVNFSQKGSSMARIGWEPISHATGTPQDPFNQATVTSAISRLSSLHFKGFSSELVSHFMDTLTVSREEVPLVVNRKLPMERYKNQVALGLDLKDGDVAVKCYIYPALKAYVSGRSFQQLLDASISQMHNPAHWALSLPMVHEYLTTAGLYNDRSFIGFDCTITSKSRLKVYNTILDVSWNKVQEIWTLGGHTANQKTIQQGLDSLGTLWKLINRGKVSIGSNHPIKRSSLTTPDYVGQYVGWHLELRAVSWE